MCSSCSTATPEEEFARGKELLEEGKRERAYKHFKRAAGKKKTDGTYHWAAASVAPNQNAAFVHAELAWKNGLKQPAVLWSLIQLSFHTTLDQKREYAFTRYEELPDSFQTSALRGELFYRFEQYDSALVIWDTLYEQSWSPTWVSKIAMAYGKMDKADSALAVLERARASKKLDAQAYVLLASMLFRGGEYKEVDRLFAESRQGKLYDDGMRVSHATLLMLQNRFGDAQSILKAISDTVADPAVNLIHHRARALLSYMAYLRRDSSAIIALRDYIEADEPKWRATETAFHEALLAQLRRDPSTLEQLRDLRKSLGGGIVDLAYARECLRRGRFEEALEGYKALPGSFRSSPGITVELARVLAGAGKEKEALAVLGDMHKRKLFTKASLELFRDLSVRQDLVEKSLAAQKLLESRFGDDVGVKWKGAMLALKRGKTDSALVLLTRLAKEHPEESRFETARLSTIFLTKDYERLIEECANSDGPTETVAVLKARAYRKLGRLREANAAFTEALAAERKPAILMEYADFLIAAEKPAKAVEVYQEIMEKHAEGLERDSLANAVVLNNLAWANLDTKTPDVKRALWAAEKAHDLAPDNPHILDTYADALLRAGKYRDCVHLLHADPLTAGEPRLIHHLATAFEQDGDINKAVRHYQDILTVMDSSAVLPVPFTEQEIRAKVTEMTSESGRK
jgi:predicted Zn-dependent protease